MGRIIRKAVITLRDLTFRAIKLLKVTNVDNTQSPAHFHRRCNSLPFRNRYFRYCLLIVSLRDLPRIRICRFCIIPFCFSFDTHFQHLSGLKLKMVKLWAETKQLYSNFDSSVELISVFKIENLPVRHFEHQLSMR